MSEFTWKPDKDSEVEGSVLLGEITVEDRLEMGMGIVDEAKDLVSEEADNIRKVSAFSKSLSIGVKLLSKYVKKVDLKNKETGAVYKSLNDLQGDLDAHGILIDLSTMYLERMQLGKFLQRLSKSKSQPTSEATV